MAGGDKRKGGGGMEKEAVTPLEERRGRAGGRDRKMKDGAWLSHKLPRGPSADCVFI